jgi:hypothetical protein
MTSRPKLADSASFIFSGSVTATNRSSVRILAGRQGLALARSARAFCIDPTMGDLVGKEITLRVLPGAEVAVGESAIFFANSWVHAEGIAVAALTPFRRGAPRFTVLKHA